MVALGKGHKNEHSVSVLSTRMNIVHFKLDRESIGAIKVYNENGDLIASEILIERKVLPDFENQAERIYK